MCPYFHEKYEVCLLYNTLQQGYHKKAYCEECEKDHRDCPNYKQCAKSNGGTVPPPYKYR